MRRRDDDDGSVVMPCPVCSSPMRLVNIERSISGMPGMERLTIQCFVCEFSMVRVVADENVKGPADRGSGRTP